MVIHVWRSGTELMSRSRRIPVFPMHDNNCSVPVELNVPYVEGKKFIDPFSRSHMSMKRGRSRGFSQASIIFEMSSRVMS